MTVPLRESVRRMVERTPDDRDRVVDAVRVAAITVVVVWHWALSVTHRDDLGRLVNPNPIPDLPFGWAVTWLLQVVPLFFLVGGFANHIRWGSTLSRGDGAADFLVDRARRLLIPTAVSVAVWLVIDGVAHVAISDHRSFFETAGLVFAPLWFVGAYAWIVALTPLTSNAHRRAPFVTLGALAATVFLLDVIRFAFDVDAAGYANTALVWVLIHQFGYFWADGAPRELTRPRAAGIAVAGVAAMAALTSLDVYPRSLVNTSEAAISHMYPTTAAVAVLAVIQFGVIMAVHPWLKRRLHRRRPWSMVVAVNAVILTIFLWHMTALYGAIRIAEAAGHTLPTQPDAAWWWTRPLWVVGPAMLLVPLIAVFGPLERRAADA